MMMDEIDVDVIPEALGGSDSWKFSADEYYGSVDWTYEQAMDYLKVVPWHAT